MLLLLALGCIMSHGGVYDWIEAFAVVYVINPLTTGKGERRTRGTEPRSQN